jgi:hypothetical protein
MEVWGFNLAFSLLFLLILWLLIILILPATLKSYALWKSSGKESELGNFFRVCFILYLSCLRFISFYLKKSGYIFTVLIHDRVNSHS